MATHVATSHQRKSLSPKRDDLKAEAFTIKAYTKNAKITPPPRAGAFEPRPTKPTDFRKFYERGDFPIALEHDTKGNKIAWKVNSSTGDWFASVTFETYIG
jgi:hypothetical protein